MKTTTTIKVYAYPVRVKDCRTGVSDSDTIVIPAEWLRICGSLGQLYTAHNGVFSPISVAADMEVPAYD